MIVLGMQGPLIFTYIIEERGFEVPQFAFLMAALGAGALLSAAFYGIQEPFLMMRLVLLLLILPFFTASQILFGASLVEIGLSVALQLAASKNPARL